MFRRPSWHAASPMLVLTCMALSGCGEPGDRQPSKAELNGFFSEVDARENAAVKANIKQERAEERREERASEQRLRDSE